MFCKNLWVIFEKPSLNKIFTVLRIITRLGPTPKLQLINGRGGGTEGEGGLQDWKLKKGKDKREEQGSHKKKGERATKKRGEKRIGPNWMLGGRNYGLCEIGKADILQHKRLKLKKLCISE